MAIPTITAVAPSPIWTGGQLVVVTGTNFRLPTLPATFPSGPLPDPTPTVQVLIDGVESSNVAVLSATRLTAWAPPHDPCAQSADGSSLVGVDVVVNNLDAMGVPIPGETATLAQSLVYALPDLSVEDDAGRVDRQIIKLLKQQVLQNVVKQVHPDYGEFPFEFTLLSDSPALVLTGPKVTQDYTYYKIDKPVVATADGLFDLRFSPPVVRFDYTLTGYAKSSSQNLTLLFTVVKFFERNIYLTIDRDKTNPAAGQISYSMFIPIDRVFQETTTPNKDGLHTFNGEFSILGVALEDIVGFPGETTMAKGISLQTVEILRDGKFVPQA